MIVIIRHSTLTMTILYMLYVLPLITFIFPYLYEIELSILSENIPVCQSKSFLRAFFFYLRHFSIYSNNVNRGSESKYCHQHLIPQFLALEFIVDLKIESSVVLYWVGNSFKTEIFQFTNSLSFTNLHTAYNS